MERTTQMLNAETSKKSVNTDSFIKISLDGEERLLPPDEIQEVVNIGERFNLERQKSKFYRILGTINPTISNSLFNLTDNTYLDKQTLAGFNDLNTFLDTSYPLDGMADLTYPTTLKRYLKEVNGWFGYFNPSKTKKGLCQFIDMEPTRKRFSFIPDIFSYNRKSTPIKNWELTLTYPKSTDTIHNMVNGGLLIVEAVSVLVSERSMIAFGMPCLHNLNIGDTVRITGTNSYDGTHTVIRTGLDNGDFKNYYFVIDVEPTGSIGPNSRMKRVVNDEESSYYFRLFTKVETRSDNQIKPIIQYDDYESYKLTFSENIYGDDIIQYVFNEDIDVTNLTDNLGRPVSELYLTITKTDSDGLFTQVSSGIETPFLPSLKESDTITYLKNIPAINRIHNGASLPFISHTPLEKPVNINNNWFYGDLVEYNRNEVRETILADISHRFNTLNRETISTLSGGYVSGLGTDDNQVVTKTALNLGPRQEGYFYKPHWLIKIRELSSYIEQGDDNTEGIPSYAENLGDGRYLWRDMLEIGFNESSEKALDYPFLNGCHYMYQNVCFNVKRQDPFNIWGLFYSKFPSDSIGEQMTNKYTSKSSDYAC